MDQTGIIKIVISDNLSMSNDTKKQSLSCYFVNWQINQPKILMVLNFQM